MKYYITFYKNIIFLCISKEDKERIIWKKIYTYNEGGYKTILNILFLKGIKVIMDLEEVEKVEIPEDIYNLITPYITKY